MINKICKGCKFAHMYLGFDRTRNCLCQNEKRNHMNSGKMIDTIMRGCKYKEV
jgi:hypothetical protein